MFLGRFREVSGLRPRSQAICRGTAGRTGAASTRRFTVAKRVAASTGTMRTMARAVTRHLSSKVAEGGLFGHENDDI